MVTIRVKNYNHPMPFGRADFANKRLHFFIGYTKCEQCSALHKVLLSPDDLRMIDSRLGTSSQKKSLGLKVTERLNKYYKISS